MVQTLVAWTLWTSAVPYWTPFWVHALRSLLVPSLDSALCAGVLAARGFACAPAVAKALLFYEAWGLNLTESFTDSG